MSNLSEVEEEQLKIGIRRTIETFQRDFQDLLKTSLRQYKWKNEDEAKKYDKLHYQKQKERHEALVLKSSAQLRINFHRLLDKLQNNSMISTLLYRQQALKCGKILYKHKQYAESHYSFFRYLKVSPNTDFLTKKDTFNDKKLVKENIIDNLDDIIAAKYGLAQCNFALLMQKDPT